MFRVYYGDGSTYTGQGETRNRISGPEGAPTQDVQCIAWDDPARGISDTGRVVLTDWDLYIYSDNVGGWMGTNKYADLVRHVQDGGVRAVLEGKWIKREKYREIKERAYTEPGLRPKSARTPHLEDGTE